MTYNSLTPELAIVAKSYDGHASPTDVSVGKAGINYGATHNTPSVCYSSTSDTKTVMAFNKITRSPILSESVAIDIGNGAANVTVANKDYRVILCGTVSFRGKGLVYLSGSVFDRQPFSNTSFDSNAQAYRGSASLVLSTGLVDTPTAPKLSDVTTLAQISRSSLALFNDQSTGALSSRCFGPFFCPIIVTDQPGSLPYGTYRAGETVNIYFVGRVNPNVNQKDKATMITGCSVSKDYS